MDFGISLNVEGSCLERSRRPHIYGFHHSGRMLIESKIGKATIRKN